MPNSLILQNNSWYVSASSPTPINFMAGIFGNGVAGDITITGSVTLSQETFYNNLTITSTGILKPNGYRIFVKNLLTINASGSINDDGISGSLNTAGGGLTARNYLYGIAGTGGAGGANGAGGNGLPGTGGQYTYNNSGGTTQGGIGGKTSPSTGTPGNPGAPSDPIAGQCVWGSWMLGRCPTTTRSGGTTIGWHGGTGGGGGASSGIGSLGGGGGGGGGCVWVAANTMINNGRISANGGNGGDASGGGNAGSGGGGGGGVVTVITNTRSSFLGSIQANGGSGGVGITGTGTTGSAGNIGATCIISFGGN